MNAIFIGSDRKLFESGSAVANRAREYGSFLEHSDYVVFSLRGLGLAETNICENVRAIPTQSRWRWKYPFDASDIASKAAIKLPAGSVVLSAQDPFEAGLAALMAGRKIKAPVQIQLHTDLFSPYFASSGLVNMVRSRMAPFILKRADGIRVVSRRIKKSLVERLGLPAERISVIPIHSDTSKFAAIKERVRLERYANHSPLVLMVGRMEKEKGFADGLKAFAKLASRHADAGLVVVGDGREKGALVSLAASLGVGDKVFFENWKDDIVPFYGSADIFMCPSLFEGYGLALIEAASAGLPIATTDVGLVGEILMPERDCLASRPSDPSSLADCLLRLADDKDLASSLGRNAKAAASAASMTKGEYLRLYEDALKAVVAEH